VEENSTESSSWRWLLPIVYLSSNWLSLTGVVIVTSATVLWLFLLPTTLRGATAHPYVGIFAFLLLPAIFLSGLVLIPLGIWWRRRHSALPARFPPLDFHNLELRRLIAFIGVTTIANFIIGSQITYAAVNYMDSVTFCGLTCHRVMEPEYTAHQNSPHARVECVACHIGPGASWFVRSKLSGTGQVFATLFDTYPRPIPVPVHDLRPARETCETCHWPEKFDSNRLKVIATFAKDETNTMTQTVLLIKIGGGMRGIGIHGKHMGTGVVVRYAASDEGRQTIPWIAYSDKRGTTVYVSPGTKPENAASLPIRRMDCIDCHNRPTHTFQLPERAVDEALAAGSILPALPFAKKESVAILKLPYAGNEDAAARIPHAFVDYYQQAYPSVYHVLRLLLQSRRWPRKRSLRQEICLAAQHGYYNQSGEDERHRDADGAQRDDIRVPGRRYHLGRRRFTCGQSSGQRVASRKCGGYGERRSGALGRILGQATANDAIESRSVASELRRTTECTHTRRKKSC
jgi:hypothetical protein